MASSLNSLCEFIHEAQKERGLTSLYLRSRDVDYSDKIEAQFAVVDKLSHALDSLPKKRSVRIDPFLNAVHYLPAKRKYVIARMIGAGEALSFYSRDLIAPAIEIVQELAVIDPANHPTHTDHLPLHELLPQINTLTLHYPLNEQTHNLINAQKLTVS